MVSAAGLQCAYSLCNTMFGISLLGLGYTNGGDLANTAIRALEDGALSANGSQPSKSTLIIHSVQRVSCQSS